MRPLHCTYTLHTTGSYWASIRNWHHRHRRPRVSYDRPAAVWRPVQSDSPGPRQPRAQGLQHQTGGAASHRRSLPVRLPGSNRLLYLPGNEGLVFFLFLDAEVWSENRASSPADKRAKVVFFVGGSYQNNWISWPCIEQFGTFEESFLKVILPLTCSLVFGRTPRDATWRLTRFRSERRSSTRAPGNRRTSRPRLRWWSQVIVLFISNTYTFKF